MTNPAVSEEMVERFRREFDAFVQNVTDMLHERETALSALPLPVEGVGAERLADLGLGKTVYFNDIVDARTTSVATPAAQPSAVAVKALRLADVLAGYEDWAGKPHNAKWASKIDGTPIPNDICVCIFNRLSTLAPSAAAGARQAEQECEELKQKLAASCAEADAFRAILTGDAK